MPPPRKPVAKPTPLDWDKLNLEWWSCAAGFVQQESNLTWTAHLYRNQRVGKGWTEIQKGFKTADKARRWIEREAED
jgi:hypothetical protein